MNTAFCIISIHFGLLFWQDVCSNLITSLIKITACRARCAQSHATPICQSYGIPRNHFSKQRPKLAHSLHFLQCLSRSARGSVGPHVELHHQPTNSLKELPHSELGEIWQSLSQYLMGALMSLNHVLYFDLLPPMVAVVYGSLNVRELGSLPRFLRSSLEGWKWLAVPFSKD